MTSEFKVAFKMGTWEEAESWLGKELPIQVGPEKVEEGTIRRRLEAIEFGCPLHYDEKVAKKAGYKGIIAPCSMVFSYSMAPYWKPGDSLTKPGDPLKIPPVPILEHIPAAGTISFITDFDMEFFAPLYLGDRVTAVSKLVGLVRKELKVGDGAFMTQETTYKNQKGEVVAVSHASIFRFSPRQKGGAG